VQRARLEQSRAVQWADLLDGLNRVRRLDIEGDGLAGQSLDLREEGRAKGQGRGAIKGQ